MSIIIIPFIADILAFAIYGFTKSRMKQKVLQGFCLAALILYLVILLYATMFSRQAVLEVRINLIPLQNFDLGMFLGQLLPNILIFIPIGIFLDGVLPKLRLHYVLLIGIGLSICIELTQLFVHVGICDIDDLIANSLGIILGAVPVRILLRS